MATLKKGGALLTAQDKVDFRVGIGFDGTPTDPIVQSSVSNYAQAASRSGKDANGIFTTVQYRRANGTLIRSSVLSGGTSPAYTTRTETLFDVDGTTVLQTLVFTLGYTNGELTSEDLL